jgi:hypothetical protein
MESSRAIGKPIWGFWEKISDVGVKGSTCRGWLAGFRYTFEVFGKDFCFFSNAKAGKTGILPASRPLCRPQTVRGR